MNKLPLDGGRYCRCFATRVAAAAAELRLRAQCNPAGPVVTLGDVAEIDSADARQTAALAAIELFPAPPPRRPADRPGPRDPGPAAAARREPDGTPLLRFERSHGPDRRCAAPRCDRQQPVSRRRRRSGSSAASAKP